MLYISCPQKYTLVEYARLCSMDLSNSDLPSASLIFLTIYFLDLKISFVLFSLIFLSMQSLKKRNVEDELARCEKDIQTIINGIFAFKFPCTLATLGHSSIFLILYSYCIHFLCYIFTLNEQTLDRIQSRQLLSGNPPMWSAFITVAGGSLKTETMNVTLSCSAF